ncbi:MAG TPA: imidazole glycerol phosphate synthase subunit HisH [Accumulibacter sp.]|uniref:imidazole glycerol phosphate synthase subunit HisH n=1 Tax=Accumulibacter sp. TaxID=2053492 RepID=UPI0026259167|nr:imidazole glycerol phosphate synthase subunit HisH [Accumulibacter sp.]MDS4056822.1 imidazole glycerol phosphate synthase subunit HisH [Accumulibacter sp.]HMV06555.1 imidazole glycerol phosphate synthase subunit HisH [Accumulibacter sp.]HMW62593.1 imidazole glycerol phosphate synthase subunit HisH [Accumulibacter sp.]HMW79785.1 imidazole glycerol phosphate synthase subunit HisH [Accumulibacter sp.]HMX68713.1 imidazole glycerol phosphate synthase subunit HisH [Accumulibacter sp.]
MSTVSSGPIVVVDYGMGNLRSVWQALVSVADGRQVLVSHDPSVVRSAERVVVPGQGAMPDCMRELETRDLRTAVLEAARNKPFLGICIGQQMLLEHSEEGDVAGLGLIAGGVRRFPDEHMVDSAGRRLKVPHMGWNQVWQRSRQALWQGIADGERFYFVHSYYVDPLDAGWVAGTTDYGIDFTSAVARDNIFATQFHPEKSARPGLAMLANFVCWKP